MSDKIIAGVTKCTYCKKESIIDETKLIWYKNHYYHNECFLQFSNLLKIDGENLINDKASLIDYVSKIFDEDYLNQKFSMNLVSLLKKNFTYKGILASLRYYREIKKKRLTEEYGISVVNFIYSEAQKYYQNLQKMREKLKEQLINRKEEIIKVSVKDYDIDRKMIDINNL